MLHPSVAQKGLPPAAPSEKPPLVPLGDDARPPRIEVPSLETGPEALNSPPLPPHLLSPLSQGEGKKEQAVPVSPLSPAFRWNPYSPDTPSVGAGFLLPPQVKSPINRKTTGKEIKPPVVAPIVSPVVAQGSPNVQAGSVEATPQDQKPVIADADAPPNEGPEEVTAILTVLRHQRADYEILPLVMQLSEATKNALISHLNGNPSLVLELCEKERGNVVAHLLQVVGPDRCEEFLRAFVQNVTPLSVNQSGCIAVSRVYEYMSAAQRREVSNEIINHFCDLAMHPYGNYAVQCIVSRGADAYTFGRVRDLLFNPSWIRTLTGNKFGSHVVESFMRFAPEDQFFQVLFMAVQNTALCEFLTTDRYANYTLQCAMRRTACNPQLRAAIAQFIMPHLPRSRFAQNIVKSWS